MKKAVQRAVNDEPYKMNHSQIKVMDIIWELEPISAKEVTLQAAGRYGWNKNTTYTVLKTLVEKGSVSRIEPGFVCKSLVPIDAVRNQETRSLIDRLFGGSPGMFLSAFFENESLSDDEMKNLRRLIDSDEKDR